MLTLIYYLTTQKTLASLEPDVIELTPALL